MPFIAIKALNFGDGVIEPGEEVPLERGRDYDQMQRAGEILWSDAPATVLDPPAPASSSGTARKGTKAPRKAES